MPVYAGAVSGVDQVVCYVYCDYVAPVCKQSRSWNSAKAGQLDQTGGYTVANPLTAIAVRVTPSGATVTSSSVNQYSLVTPVSGTSV